MAWRPSNPARGQCGTTALVLQDLLGLTPHQPRFVPVVDRSASLAAAIDRYVTLIETGRYPAAEHWYSMPDAERSRFAAAGPNP